MPTRTCVVTFSDGSARGREWKRVLALARFADDNPCAPAKFQRIGFKDHSKSNYVLSLRQEPATAAVKEIGQE